MLKVVLGLLLACAAVNAEAIYSARVHGCKYELNQGPGTQFAATGNVDCASPGWVFTYSTAYAEAGESGLKASSSSQQFCCGSAGNVSAIASVTTEYIIAGPLGSGPVLGSLNVVLDAGVGGGVTPGISARTIRFDVNIGFVGNYFTEFTEASDGLNGLSHSFSSNIPTHQGYAGGVCGPCRVRTTEALFPVNQRLPFHMALLASVSQFGDAFGVADAAHTLYFPTSGPVFNLPEGYSATVFGMNVEDNEVVGLDDSGAEVPEPAAGWLIAAGFAGLAGTRRMRRPFRAGSRSR